MIDTLTKLDLILQHAAQYTESVYFDSDEDTGELRVVLHVPSRGGQSIVVEGTSAKEVIDIAHAKLAR